MRFKYKNNYYKLMQDGTYRIRSNANVDNAGYSYYYVTDENMVSILDEYLEEEKI